jgi:excisionase family DNA binding protein
LDQGKDFAGEHRTDAASQALRMDPRPETDRMIVTLTIAELREVIKEEIKGLQMNNGHSTREWLKAEELAAEYGLPKTWFEERGRSGEIARTKPGRYVLFKRRDVEAYLDQHCKKEPINS